MPLPIRPHPSTPTRLMSFMGFLASARARPRILKRFAHFLRDPHKWVHARKGRILADLAPLEAIEHLFQGDLNALVVGSMGPSDREGCRDHGRCGDQPDRPEHE